MCLPMLSRTIGDTTPSSLTRPSCIDIGFMFHLRRVLEGLFYWTSNSEYIFNGVLISSLPDRFFYIRKQGIFLMTYTTNLSNSLKVPIKNHTVYKRDALLNH